MELSVGERIALLSLLPKEGHVVDLRIYRQVADELSFTEEEHRQLAFQQVGDQLRWNQTGIKKNIEFPARIKEKFVDKFSDLEKTGKMSLDLLGLYDKFIPPEGS